MAPDWQPTAIEGVRVRHLVSHPDDRGMFRELWRSSWPNGGVDASFVQANLSRSARGVLRGLHFHRRQADLWMVLRGRALVAAVDLRGVVAGTAERPVSVVIEAAEGDCVLIPELVAHGFWALDELDLLYLVTKEYDGTDELGFAWDDPLAAVEWPGAEPLLSSRDATAPSLIEALGTISGG